tara:strand:- start:3227 stop:3682 length:456 start_codon:yes stop_codon:yes gene_type:complete
MDLLKTLKNLSEEELSLPIFIRMSTMVGNIRSVDVVSSKIFKKSNGEFCQILSVRNSDFDKDYIQNYCEAKGLNLEYYEEDGEYEELSINIIKTIKDLISNLELNLREDIKDVKYSVLTGLGGKEYQISSITKDSYSCFGIVEECYIIEIK